MARGIRITGTALLAALLGYALFFAWQTLRPRAIAGPLPDGLLPGDVVLMRSHTWRAEAVRLIDGVPYRDGFSHVGVVQDRTPDGTYRLVHAVPGAEGTVRLEPWPFIARGGGSSEAVVFRAALSDKQRERMQALGADLAARAVPFDGGFDHHDPQTLYCTELVTYLYAAVGQPVLGERRMAKRAIFPGDLAASDIMRVVGRTEKGLEP